MASAINGILIQTHPMHGSVGAKFCQENVAVTENQNNTEEHVERVVAYVKENPVITLSEMRSKLELEFRFSISYMIIHEHVESKF